MSVMNDKLNKKEDEVMSAVFRLAAGKEQVLVSPYEIIAMLPPKANYDTEKLESVLHALELDGYFELILSDRKGEPMYVIRLKQLGLAYERDAKKRRRGVIFKWSVAAVGAVITFAVGMILKAIFSS